jgi:hypothetical protein
MTPPPTSSGPNRPARPRDAGIGQLGGFAVMAVTAAVVFSAGKHWVVPPPAPVPPPVVAPPPVPQPPQTAVAATAAVDATAVDATVAGAATADAGTAVRPGATTTTPVPAAAAQPADATASENANKTTTTDKDKDKAKEATVAAKSAGEAAPEATAPAARKPGPPESQADKDLAHESWRKNKPDVSTAGGKASILIPIKGSTEDGDYKFNRRTRTVTITLPKAASLNTMHFYKLKRDGFHALWTDQAEKDARASDGTKLRLVLAVSADPQVELRDDFVRVTIARPEAKAAPAGEAAEAPDEGSSEEKE